MAAYFNSHLPDYCCLLNFNKYKYLYFRQSSIYNISWWCPIVLKKRMFRNLCFDWPNI